MKDNPLYNYNIAPNIKLLADKVETSSSVSIGLFFPVGSGFEKIGEHGLSHFVEHMIFKGAGKRNAQELSRAIDRVGGYLNAFTERDVVCVYCLMPVEFTDLAIEILLDMIYRPGFSEENFKNEKDVIINEILAADDDKEEAAQDEFFAMSYVGHPYANKIAGTRAEVEKLTYSDLINFHDEKFFHGRLIISISGNIEPDHIAELCKNRIPDVPRIENPIPQKVKFSKARCMVKTSGSQIYIFTGLDLEDIIEDDYWLLTTASSAYGESMSSRLFTHLRDDKGLCYGISSSFSLSVQGGLWGVASSTMPEQLEKFLYEYKNESEKFYKDGLQEVEVDEAMTRIKGLLSIAKDDTEYRMKRIARQYLFEGRIESIEETKNRFCENGCVNMDSVNKIIKERLNPENENILLYGALSKKNIKAGESIFSLHLERTLDE